MTGWTVVAVSLGCLRTAGSHSKCDLPKKPFFTFSNENTAQRQPGCPGFLTTRHLCGVVGAGCRAGR